MNNEQLLSDAQQRLKIIKFCINLKHLLSRLTKTRKPKETHCQVSLDSVYKHFKTQRRFPPRIALCTYCNASNQLGMIIFAPVPLRCPTSSTSNGCRVLFGLERIKLSPPCCVLIYCFRHFHIWFIFALSAAARRSCGSRWPEPLAAGTAKWLRSGGTGPASPGERAAAPAPCGHSQAICRGATRQPTCQSLGNEKGDCDAVRDPSARHLSVIVLFPQENKGSPSHANYIKNVVLRVVGFCRFFFFLPWFCLVIM